MIEVALVARRRLSGGFLGQAGKGLTARSEDLPARPFFYRSQSVVVNTFLRG
jgi:hypothetical protein